MTDTQKLTEDQTRDRAARAVWDTLGADFTFDEALSGQEKATHAEAIEWVYTVADTVIRAVSAERDAALARAEAAEEKAAEAALSALQAYGQAETAYDAQKAAEAKADRLAELVHQGYAEGYNKAAVTLLGTALGPTEVDMKRAWLISHAFASLATLTTQEGDLHKERRTHPACGRGYGRAAWAGY